VSLEIVLIPLAIAAVSAYKASQVNDESTGQVNINVQTRMKNQEMLIEALRVLGLSASFTDNLLRVGNSEIEFLMRKNENDIWTAQFENDVSEEAATSLLISLDKEYGKLVQATVLQRIKERASVNGMNLQSEIFNRDNSVTLTLNVLA
jgi:hypothetical protein